HSVPTGTFPAHEHTHATHERILHSFARCYDLPMASTQKSPSPCCFVQQRSLLRDTILCNHLFGHIRYFHKQEQKINCLLACFNTCPPLPTKPFFTPSHGGTFYRCLEHNISIPFFRSTTLSEGTQS
ncbi:unnamed protein product, partial [Ectocarpus sp. 8 AP-2014]